MHLKVILLLLSHQEALDIVRIHAEDRESMFAVLSAVLWLGNISFQVTDNENHVEVVAGEGMGSCFSVSVLMLFNKVSY